MTLLPVLYQLSKAKKKKYDDHTQSSQSSFYTWRSRDLQYMYHNLWFDIWSFSSTSGMYQSWSSLFLSQNIPRQRSLSRDFSTCPSLGTKGRRDRQNLFCPGTKGQRDRENFVPGQRDNWTFSSGLSRDVPRDVRSLRNSSFNNEILIFRHPQETLVLSGSQNWSLPKNYNSELAQIYCTWFKKNWLVRCSIKNMALHGCLQLGAS